MKMYCKTDGYECECGNKIKPPFGEIHFDMIDGDIFENMTNDMVCEKCGAIYRLVDVTFWFKWKRLDTID